MAIVDNYYERRMEIDSMDANNSNGFLYQVLPLTSAEAIVMEEASAVSSSYANECDNLATDQPMINDENKEKELFSRQKTLSPYTPTIDADS